MVLFFITSFNFPKTIALRLCCRVTVQNIYHILSNLQPYTGHMIDFDECNLLKKKKNSSVPLQCELSYGTVAEVWTKISGFVLQHITRKALKKKEIVICCVLSTKFSENEGRGSLAVWNFSENSSDLVAGPFPKLGFGFAKKRRSRSILRAWKPEDNSMNAGRPRKTQTSINGS